MKTFKTEILHGHYPPSIEEFTYDSATGFIKYEIHRYLGDVLYYVKRAKEYARDWELERKDLVTSLEVEEIHAEFMGVNRIVHTARIDIGKNLTDAEVIDSFRKIYYRHSLKPTHS